MNTVNRNDLRLEYGQLSAELDKWLKVAKAASGAKQKEAMREVSRRNGRLSDIEFFWQNGVFPQDEDTQS